MLQKEEAIQTLPGGPLQRLQLAKVIPNREQSATGSHQRSHIPFLGFNTIQTHEL